MTFKPGNGFEKFAHRLDCAARLSGGKVLSSKSIGISPPLNGFAPLAVAAAAGVDFARARPYTAGLEFP